MERYSHKKRRIYNGHKTPVGNKQHISRQTSAAAQMSRQDSIPSDLAQLHAGEMFNKRHSRNNTEILVESSKKNSSRWQKRKRKDKR